MSEKREGHTPIYRCHAKGCGYATDNLGAFVQHVLDEKLRERESASIPKTPKGHRTVQEYLNCPECYPKFEKVILEYPEVFKELEKRGWKKKSKGLELEI